MRERFSSESPKITPVHSSVEIALRMLKQSFTNSGTQEGSLTQALRDHGRRMLRNLLPKTNQ